MVNKEFEAYKLKRELKRSGVNYKFERNGVNEFGEPSEESEVVAEICGLYHEQNSYVQVTTGDTARTRTKKIPMILCLYDDIASLAIDDKVIINKRVFKVTGVTNIQEWSIIADISLEVIDNGI